MRRAGRCLVLLWTACAVAAEPGSAQVEPSEPPRRIDLEIAYVTASWLWPVDGGWRLGPELGLGILEQQTFAPAEDDFTSVFHVGATSAIAVGGSVGLELGLRVGLAELRSESCSGCVPGRYVGATSALFVGGRRLQGGTRLTLGRASGRGFVAWSPLVARIRF